MYTGDADGVFRIITTLKTAQALKEVGVVHQLNVGGCPDQVQLS